jgi:predicted GNAT family acetyltransferase
MQPEHRPQECCFLYQTGQAEARLDYRLLQINGHNAVDFYHTFVPPALRGQGIAAALTTAGLDWARQQQLRIHASCSYVAQQLRR